VSQPVTMWAVVYDYEAPKPRNFYHSEADARKAWGLAPGQDRRDGYRLTRVEVREVSESPRQP
jgi:hypothetical protein